MKKLYWLLLCIFRHDGPRVSNGRLIGMLSDETQSMQWPTNYDTQIFNTNNKFTKKWDY